MKKVLFLLIAVAGAAVGIALWRRRAESADIWSELDPAPSAVPPAQERQPAPAPVIAPAVVEEPAPKAPRKRAKPAEGKASASGKAAPGGKAAPAAQAPSP